MLHYLLLLLLLLAGGLIVLPICFVVLPIIIIIVVAINSNNIIDVSIFPTSIKIANITPIFKKGSKNSKKNYRPVSILPNISTIYERSLFKQMSNYFENIFSKFHCGFNQGLSAKYCLISMTKKWKKSVDKGKKFAALLNDLSKTFDYLFYYIILAKSDAYGFSLSPTRLIQSYLSNRKQNPNISNTYSL